MDDRPLLEAIAGWMHREGIATYTTSTVTASTPPPVVFYRLPASIPDAFAIKRTGIRFPTRLDVEVDLQILVRATTDRAANTAVTDIEDGLHYLTYLDVGTQMQISHITHDYTADLDLDQNDRALRAVNVTAWARRY